MQDIDACLTERVLIPEASLDLLDVCMAGPCPTSLIAPSHPDDGMFYSKMASATFPRTPLTDQQLAGA